MKRFHLRRGKLLTIYFHHSSYGNGRSIGKSRQTDRRSHSFNSTQNENSAISSRSISRPNVDDFSYSAVELTFHSQLADAMAYTSQMQFINVNSVYIKCRRNEMCMYVTEFFLGAT